MLLSFHCYLIILVTYSKVFILKPKSQCCGFVFFFAYSKINSEKSRNWFFFGLVSHGPCDISSWHVISQKVLKVDHFYVIVFKLRQWAFWRKLKYCYALNTSLRYAMRTQYNYKTRWYQYILLNPDPDFFLENLDSSKTQKLSVYFLK